jgi:hypothetical protein
MSHNLCLEIDGREVDLYQTPTYVTYMCLVNEMGEVESRESDEAIAGLVTYFKWVRASVLSPYSPADEDEKQENIAKVNAHIQNIGLLMASSKSIKIYLT